VAAASPAKAPPAAAPSGDEAAPRPETPHVTPHVVPARAASAGAPDRPARSAARATRASAPSESVRPDRPGAPGAGHGPRAAAAAGAGAARPTGTVRVSSSPWAEVRVGGRPERCAETPCTLMLPAGTYTLSLRNPVAQLDKTVTVVVRASETVTVRETLTAPR
jgi:hypothetical protein